MKSVVDYYNKTATGWSTDWMNEKVQNNVLSTFNDMFVKAKTFRPKILDLGCGAGYDSKILSSLGAKVYGVDISEKLIEIAEKNVPDCKFFVGDITDSLANLGKFDGICCLATIVHIGIESMKRTMSNIADALKPGGLLLISSFNGNGKDTKKSYVNIDGDDYDCDFNCYSVTELCAFSYPKMKLVDTLKFDDFNNGWRYYVFMKK